MEKEAIETGMIISRQFAKEVNKAKLAELATGYADEFADKLGAKTRIEIKPEEIIYDPVEAEAFFLKKFKPNRKNSNWAKKFAKARYNDRKMDIREKEPFVDDGVAYTPISELSKNDVDLVSRVFREEEKPESLTAHLWEKLSKNKSDYVSLNGFGAEIGHLVGKKLYGGRIQGGIGETFDFLSTLYELSLDIRILCGSEENQADTSLLEAELVDELIDAGRLVTELYETLLFKGEASAEKKLIEIGSCKDRREAKERLALFKINYITTTHFDGFKLFLEIYDRENCDLGKTYTKLGEILSVQGVMTVEDTLRELGFSERKLSRYKGAFGADMMERAKRIDELKP